MTWIRTAEISNNQTARVNTYDGWRYGKIRVFLNARIIHLEDGADFIINNSNLDKIEVWKD